MICILRELSIRNFALIEHLHLLFEDGFHVLTGETGAGKSIFVDALGLLAGGRASSEFVRHSTNKAEIEALFEVGPDHPVRGHFSEWGMDDIEGSFVIRREITAAGKSYCRVNGRIVTLTMLKQIGSKLVDISGQHEHQMLLSKDEHLELLDQFGGKELLDKKTEYNDCFAEYQKLCCQLEDSIRGQREAEQRIDLYRYQIEEIFLSNLREGEDEQLEKERTRLVCMDQLLLHTRSAYEFLSAEAGALDQTRQAVSHFEGLIRLDERTVEMHREIEHAFYQLEEVSRKLKDYLDELSYEPSTLSEVEDRIYTINQLKRKYGDTILDILTYKCQITNELDDLLQRDQQEDQLKIRKTNVEKKLIQLSAQLTQLRKKIACQLEKKMIAELFELNMKSAIFHVSFLPCTEFQITGQDAVEFQISSNPGEPLRSLVKVASGGELSRMMLALKCIFSHQSHFHTLVLDEIDTGVSGKVAQLIAEKIVKLSSHHQVFCVTHLPQVACMADVHLFIHKETVSERTYTQVHSLDDKKQIVELARMLGGAQVTKKTYEHAEEMVDLAIHVKETI